MKISVIIKDPGNKPRHVNVSNTLKNLQNIVGGYLETVMLTSDVVIICDEEGQLKGRPHNCNICGVDFCGTIVLAGVEDGEFAHLPGCYQDYKLLLPQLWRDE